MKEVKTTLYQCETCLRIYDSDARAKQCESRPVTHDRGVKVGDTVRVTAGDGKGLLATVERVSVIDRDWGHYAWERYWHTVALEAKLIGSAGHRLLTFDNYELA